MKQSALPPTPPSTDCYLPPSHTLTVCVCVYGNSSSLSVLNNENAAPLLHPLLLLERRDGALLQNIVALIFSLYTCNARETQSFSLILLQTLLCNNTFDLWLCGETKMPNQ